MASGAPPDFAGRVLSNPDNISPTLDTDKPEIEGVSPDTKQDISNAPLKTQEGNISNAHLGNPAMQPRKRVLDKTIPFDPIGDIMRHYKIPMTRENYVALNHLGDSADATPEEDAETPTRFQPAYPTHDELAREKGKKTESKKK